MEPNALGPAHLKRCVFLARYRKRGVNQWARIAHPEIETDDIDYHEMYQEPQLEVISPEEVHIRVRDDTAVDLTADNLLGDYHAAARRCDACFRQHFVGHVIVDSLSSWSPNPTDE